MEGSGRMPPAARGKGEGKRGKTPFKESGFPPLPLPSPPGPPHPTPSPPFPQTFLTGCHFGGYGEKMSVGWMGAFNMFGVIERGNSEQYLRIDQKKRQTTF